MHAAVANVQHYRHIKKQPLPLHFLMNAYKDVGQREVETIPAVRGGVEWRPWMMVRIADSKEEVIEWALVEDLAVTLFSDGSLIDACRGSGGVMREQGGVMDDGGETGVGKVVRDI
jgi:hypothetical protein